MTGDFERAKYRKLATVIVMAIARLTLKYG
jgi:hypothetical protein